MESKDYLKDIQDIKQMMSQSSQFISLSGLSGVLAGVYALVGAFLAHSVLAKGEAFNSGMNEIYSTPSTEVTTSMFVIAAIVLVSSVVTAIVLSNRKAKVLNEKMWNSSSKRLAINFCIPLVTGGIFALLLFDKKHYELIAPAMLLFYGLACLNASKYTLRDIRYLGITNIFIGLLATYFSGGRCLSCSLGLGIHHVF